MPRLFNSTENAPNPPPPPQNPPVQPYNPYMFYAPAPPESMYNYLKRAGLGGRSC